MLWLIKKIPVMIYDFFISTFLTISAHLIMLDYMHLSSGNFLDIGCGTGAPLKKISESIKKLHSKIVGIDLHPEYTEKAIEVFKGDTSVEIYNMDFYQIEQYLKLTFRFIFFSFSFMLMPDPGKALMIAKSILEKNESSRIAFILTLNQKQSSFLYKMKPLIRKLTTIDFGNVIYEDKFEEYLRNANLEVTKKIRIKKNFNLLLMIFPVYYVECKVKN